MEENKKSTRKHIVRKASEGHAEKVDYSTSRSFSSDERPARRSYSQDRPAYGERHSGERRSSYGAPRPERSGRPENGKAAHAERKVYGEGRPATEHKPYGERKSSYGSKTGATRGGGFSKPGFSNKGSHAGKPGARKPYTKHSEADAGMTAMLSRKPQVIGRYSDDDTAPTEIQEVMRLNKFIANSGVCSRREADTLIQSGVVTVNGEVVTELGVKVNILNDDIRFNGQRLKGEDKVYIVMNKPKGYVTTASDPHAEKTVMELLRGCPTRATIYSRS